MNILSLLRSYKYNLTKVICLQNIFLTLGLGLTNIYYAKLYHFMKICIGLPFIYYNYKILKKHYFLFELCYSITLYIGVYLGLDIYKQIIPSNVITDSVINSFYNTSFIFASSILTLSTFLNKDRFTITDLVRNSTNLIHIDNGFIFLMIQYNNLINNVNTNFSYINYIYCILIYSCWLILYNKIMYNNLVSKDPQNNIVDLFCKGNLRTYIFYHSILSTIGISLGYYLFYNFKIQLYLFCISYLGMVFFTGLF